MSTWRIVQSASSIPARSERTDILFILASVTVNTGGLPVERDSGGDPLRTPRLGL